MGKALGVAFNPPSEHVIPVGDDIAGRLMCAFQLLGMYELVPDTSYEALNEFCYREPGEYAAFNSLVDTMLFERGFDVISFSGNTFDFEAAMTSIEVWRTGALRTIPDAFKGRSDEEVRQLWHEWRRQQQGFTERRQKYIAQITAVDHEASRVDLDTQLDAGRIALMVVQRNGIYVIDGLVYGKNGDGSYLAYNPLTGRLDTTADQLFPDGPMPLSTWALPQ